MSDHQVAPLNSRLDQEEENCDATTTTTTTRRPLLLPLHRNLESSGAATRQRKGGGRPLQQSLQEASEASNDKIKSGSNPTFGFKGLCDGTPRRRCSRQQLFRKQTIVQIIQWARTYPKRALAVIALIAVILRPSLTWKWYTTNFGRHYLQGGYIGKRILEDGSMKQVLAEKLQREQEEMDALGIDLGPTRDLNDRPFRVLNLRFDTAYRTLLVQREKRAKLVARLEREADDQGNAVESTIPQVIFVPQAIGWVPPRPGILKSLQRITFDDQERQQAVADSCPGLKETYQSANSDDKIQIWSICMVYYYGGYFLGDRIKSPDSYTEIDDLDERSFYGKATFSGERVNALAATPRHRILRCIVDRLAETKDLTSLSDAFFSGREHVASAELHCSQKSGDCCNSVQAKDSLVSTSDKGQAVFSVSQQTVVQIDPSKSRSTNVTISRMEFDDPKVEKRTIESQLWKRGIQPSWSCMRCLMMPKYGKMSKCSRFCNSAYSEFMCHPTEEEVFHEVPVRVSRYNQPELMQIPRIIHQTWFEEINFDRYPQLARLQNSWKQTGWEYRLYTDESARRYILDNFPPIFVEAFDVLKPGAFRADFFRYVVLMREGGIYSDVDVLLETNLDTLVRPGLSFFVPRDVVAEYADDAYCLWNGLIGAVPGHPIIIRAVERLVNHIIERADIHDMERSICRNEQDADLWKIHTQPLLILTGPCALGISMNEALGRPSLKGIDIGWTSLDVPDEFGSTKDAGDALILVLDKYDLGGFRFSDPDRNVIVASTNFEGLEKSSRSIAHPSKAEQLRQRLRKNEEHIHYSKATKGTFVWGSEGIYRDKLVSKFRIKFLVDYV